MDQMKRERLSALAKAVAALTDEQRAELARSVPITTIEGRSLSVHNNCMLAMQREAVTIVGGYRQWLKAGRQVRKGEHALCLWVPTGKRSDESSDSDEDRKPGFILGNVFDVSQTDAISGTRIGTCRWNAAYADQLDVAARSGRRVQS